MPKHYRRTAVVFSVPPRFVLSGNTELLTLPEKKKRILENIGTDEVLALEFSDVREMPPEEFLSLISRKYKPAYISCGFNYRFGKDGAGDTRLLYDFCRKNGIVFRCIPPVLSGGEAVSSTKIRSLLKDGRPEEANALLCEPFSFEAVIIGGRHCGRTIGFPTVNQRYPEALVQLKFGVYKTEVRLDCGSFEGITNIGIRPTFKSDYVISETYIKGFSGNLYGKRAEIIPIKFLREERRFSSLEEVKQQILIDIKS